MARSLALIVDDEPDICELLSMTLARMSVDAVAVHSVTDAKVCLQQQNFALCLTDMRMPDGDGIELVRYIQQYHSELPVAVITAYGNVEGAVNTLKAGAFDYVSKPINLDMLRNLVRTALQLSSSAPNDSVSKTPSTQLLLGKSAVIVQLRQTIHKLARSQAPVYISGQSGVGKELVARMIHQEGPRATKPFVPVNCGAIPAELVESEFFGYKKGSFTGAVTDKIGLFQAAQGGTLFLDEVADLPLTMQVKLLRAIQEKAIRTVGGQEEIPVDVRILSATHKDLQQMVYAGTFRQDLFYRINVIELKVPPLSARREDIPLLVEHMLAHYAKQHATVAPQLAEDSLIALKNYHFPGNIRELENIIERAITLCEHNIIRPIDLNLQKITDDQAIGLQLPLDARLETEEKKAILDALEKTHWNRTEAAKLLGISFRALRYRLQKMGL
ncbi:MAG: sigma-54 dependent transcriptional regulator [Gammaproteobacteria bacterium]